MNPCYRWDGPDLLVNLRVQPRASRDELMGVSEGLLRVRITAPPVEGRANEHLLRFLAQVFAVRRQDLALESGLNGRHKRLRIKAPASLPKALAP